MTTAVLKLKSSDGTYLNYTLDKVITTIGRSRTNDIVVDDTSISRLHVRIENRDGQYFVIDNNSSNGTYLNRRKISTAPLQDGDMVIAGQVQFYFSQQVVGGAKTQTLPLMGNEENLPGLGQTVIASSGYEDTPPSGQQSIQPAHPTQAPEPPPVTPPMPPPSVQAPPAPPTPPTAPSQNVAPPPSPYSGPPPTPGYAPPPQPSTPYQNMLDPELFDVASPFSRLIAYFLDYLFVMVTVLPSIALTFLGQETLGMILSLLPLVASLVNWIGGWLKYGKTIGKHLMGLRIIDVEAPQKQGLAPVTMIKRIIGFFICGLTFNLLLLTILFDDEGRGFHDKFAGTKVVKY